MANNKSRDYTVTPDCFTGLTEMELSQLIIILLEKMHKSPNTEERREG